MDLWSSDGEPDCGAILDNVAASGLFVIPDGLKPLVGIGAVAGSGDEAASADSLPGETSALLTFLEAPFSQVPPYEQYVSGMAPFDTHQGVKGQEFDRVMVIMDDSEARGFMFGYEKLLGAKERTSTDLANESAGKETGLDRTRRLFYVTSSRARCSLALVAYSADPERVKSHVLKCGWFDESEILLGV
jgi:DNA helicase-2/ATP-dependent DNA helicase PcrA